MSEYKPNSHLSKAESKPQLPEKKIEKVVTGLAKTKKKNGIRKLADGIISEDKEKVKSYILEDVIIPAIKDTIYNVIAGGAGILLDRGTNRGGGQRSTSKVSYRQYYEPREERRSASVRFDYDDIVFNTRVEAEAALDQMTEVIKRYGFVTVGDLYDMADLTQPYTSNKYGWMNINSAEVVRVRDGYVLKLPKASPID